MAVECTGNRCAYGVCPSPTEACGGCCNCIGGCLAEEPFRPAAPGSVAADRTPTVDIPIPQAWPFCPPPQESYNVRQLLVPEEVWSRLVGWLRFNGIEVVGPVQFSEDDLHTWTMKPSKEGPRA